MLLEFCLEKELCVSNTRFKRKEKRRVIIRMGENETKINLVLIFKDGVLKACDEVCGKKRGGSKGDT